MHTDTIFYQIFLTFHTLLFELLGQPTENAEGYNFTSVEVKEKAFRFDGIFMPDSMEKSIYFVEVQFQPKPEFYWELITEINIYLNQYKPQQDWQAVALFAKRSLDPTFRRSYGTRSTEGSLAYCSILSVIETCRLRKIDPWDYIAMVLTQARRGIKHPPIPVAS